MNIDPVLAYATMSGAGGEVIGWLNTAGSKALRNRGATADDLEHIVDYLLSPGAPSRLQKMSYADAKRKAREWSERNQKKGRGLIDGPDDIEVIHDFLDTTKIVRLKTKRALQREGFLMGHCVGGYSPDSDEYQIYSYRDAKNMPHATFEVRRDANEIVQIKGKGNGAIHPKYIHPILAFLKAIGMDVRPNDMKNLGYYHVDEHMRSRMNLWPSMLRKTVMIAGEMYAF